VVVRHFVNPQQFGPHEDFQRYPEIRSGPRRIARRNATDLIWFRSRKLTRKALHEITIGGPACASRIRFQSRTSLPVLRPWSPTLLVCVGPEPSRCSAKKTISASCRARLVRESRIADRDRWRADRARKPTASRCLRATLSGYTAKRIAASSIACAQGYGTKNSRRCPHSRRRTGRQERAARRRIRFGRLRSNPERGTRCRCSVRRQEKCESSPPRQSRHAG